MRCKGCGAQLQDIDKNLDGYTPDVMKDFCQRCFQITHYGKNIKNKKAISNKDILLALGKYPFLVIFLVDYLNIYEEVIATFKNISNPKMLVITKSDLIPKNINKDVLVDNIKRVYDLKEDIIYVSSKSKENIIKLKEIILKEKKVLIMGYTNTGKSSLINTLTNSNLTISKRANTTLDFMKIKMLDGTIYDTPGFVPTNFLDNLLPKKIIKPVIYQLASKYCLEFLNYQINSQIANNFIFFISNEVTINKRKLREELPYKIKVPQNSDLIIKGLGFILIKKEAIISTNIPSFLYEVRPTIIGGKNE